MRCLERNKQKIYYASYLRSEPTLDEYDKETGEQTLIYGDPVEASVNFSASHGEIFTRQFGDIEKYDKVIVFDNDSLPLTKSSILWVDSLDVSKSHDYIVKEIAKSLNSTAVAISKVQING